MKDPNRFVFIVPCYNARQTIKQMLMSVVAQSYPHWRIIMRDDCSTDDTAEYVQKLANNLYLPVDKVTIKVNQEKKWEVANILDMLKEVEPDEIVCRLDGDDWLCDLDALNIINQRYWDLNVDALWTAHRWAYSNMNISSALPKYSDPYVHPWVSSHLKTFRKKLIEGVKDENFRGADGEYFKRIGDQAIYLPVLKRAQGNYHYEPIVAYHYSIDLKPQTFQTDDAKFQKNEALFLRQRGYIP